MCATVDLRQASSKTPRTAITRNVFTTLWIVSLLVLGLPGFIGAAEPARVTEPTAAGILHDREALESIRHDQSDLADSLLQTLADPHSTDQETIFRLARMAIESRHSMVGTGLSQDSGPHLDQELLNLDTAEEALAISKTGSDLDHAVAFAQLASKWQSQSLGLEWTAPVPLTGHMQPSAALAELTVRHGAKPTGAQWTAALALDGLDPELALALARVVDAFIALDTAARVAYAEADLDALERLNDEAGDLGVDDRDLDRIPTLVGLADPAALPVMEAAPSPGEVLHEAGVDLTLVFTTRNQFLDAILELDNAIAPLAPVTRSSCSPIQVPPAFSISLGGCDDHYTQDFALILDIGGKDVYHNNAGGSNLGGPGNCRLQLMDPKNHLTAALVDLGSGDDLYGDPLAPRGCGANGGGEFLNMGFLLDGGGDDTYTATQFGANGGGSYGAVGFLLDAGGSDIYTATQAGTNGGAESLGVGFLLDTGGNDLYTATSIGTNGGAASGMGFLVDAEGSDTYTATARGTNGGAVGGAGLLVDAGGDDAYTATDTGTNGGGYYSGNGFLLDASGDDVYVAGSVATNGGGIFGGVGLLFDTLGNDTYHAEACGTNGGGADLSCGDIVVLVTVPGYLEVGVGRLMDLGGLDHYQDPAIPGGSCSDCTILTKGLVGTQVDHDMT